MVVPCIKENQECREGQLVSIWCLTVYEVFSVISSILGARRYAYSTPLYTEGTERQTEFSKE